LSKNDYRIILWRNTIQLFHEYKRPNFVGPFKAAKLSYVVDRPFLTMKGNEKRPDIVASGEAGWLVLELTTNDKSKESKLDSYKTIDPRYLSSYGLIPHKNEPDIICSRLSCVNDGPFCQILVKDFFSVTGEDNLGNKQLKTELIKAKEINLDLRRLPEIPITLVPEMRNQEIRRGLIEIVMQIFEPNSNGKTTIQMVDEGLERLSDIVGVTEKRSLLVKIDAEMDILIRNHLSGYFEFKDNTYKATEKFKQHHKTFGFVSLRLKEWAGPTPQTTIGDERWQ
jgi:hypothetical protein